MSKPKDAAAPIDLDAILVELGQFGRYQKFVYFYLGIAILFTSVYNCQYIFNAGSVEYRCRVPQCESSPEKFSTNGWGHFALPSTGYNCHRRVAIGDKCEPASFSNQSTRCYSWIYENSYTIVPEFDLACQEWKRTLVGTIHNVGVFMAIPSTATVSDAFGRRFALIGTAVAPAIVGMLRAFCSHYLVYLLLEFIEALVGNGTYSTAFIIGLEIVGLNKRVMGGNIIHCTFATGQVVAAVSSWAMPYWRTYTFVIFAPSLLFIFYCVFVEESVRWLIAKGKRDEAVRIILKIARINRVTLLPNTMNLLNPSPPKKPLFSNRERLFPEPNPKEDSMLFQVLRSRTIMFRMVVVSFWWISVTMIYYGLTINAVSLVGNKYVNFVMTALVEIPGALLCYLTLDRFGRKSSIMTSFFVCGLSLLVLPAVDNRNNCDHHVDAVGQDDDQPDLLRHLHLHHRAVPDAGAPHADGVVLHDRAHRLHDRAADASVDGVHEVAAVPAVRHNGRLRGDAYAVHAGDAAHETARHYRAG